MTETGAAALAHEVAIRLTALGDAEYVAGTVAARSPGKPVLGIRIPLLRAAVRAALKASPKVGSIDVLGAADLLWRSKFHEAELAGCMLLRLTGTSVTVPCLRDWGALLDNWLSVDELGGCVAQALASDAGILAELGFLSSDTASVWERRLYVVSLISIVRQGRDPATVPRLIAVMQDDAPPVRKAATWLLTAVLKKRPPAAAEFLAVWPRDAPKPLTRILQRVPA